jgi:hypothetical protein
MQTNFFNIVTNDNETIPVSVYREGDHYRADISGGWWTVTGPTEKAAVKAVVERYRMEHECYDL